MICHSAFINIIPELLLYYFYDTLRYKFIWGRRDKGINIIGISLLFACDSDNGPFDTEILAGFLVLRAVLDCVCFVPVSTTERTCVGTEYWACHFPLRIFEVVRRVETLRFSIITTEYTHLWLGVKTRSLSIYD